MSPLSKLRDDFDSYDPWGWCIGWMFALCDEIHFRRDVEVPPELQYRPAMTHEVDDDSYAAEVLGDLTDEEVMYCLTRLARYDKLLRKHGKDY